MSSPAPLRTFDPAIDASIAHVRALYERGLYVQAFTAARALGPMEAWGDPADRTFGHRLLANVGAPAQASLLLARTWRAHRRHPEVVGAYTVSGQADALVHLRAADIGHLEQALERLRAEPFVTSTRSMVVLSRLIEVPTPVPAPR